MLKLNIDLGEEKRIIYAGIKKSYSPDELVDKLVIVIANLMPREMKFGTSDGMMLATQNNGEIIFLEFHQFYIFELNYKNLKLFFFHFESSNNL